MSNLPVAMRYVPETGQYWILRGRHWEVLDDSEIEGLTESLAAAVSGIGNGYKVARGVHQQAAASDTVVTGLATVVAVVATLRDAPTAKQMFFTASIGNQTGAPAAGSILLKSYKPTAVDNATPIAATDFTDNLSVNWIAIGT